MKALLILLLLIPSTVFAAKDHPLGTPNVVFCKAFVQKISRKMPIPYQDIIKLTDGEGMPVAKDRRHWDGKNGSSLTITLYSSFVKGGLVTCPSGESIPFGAWD